jgi:uncharacterized Zn-binding protein involved in type VI secretion
MKTKNTWLIGTAVMVIAAALFTGCSNPEGGGDDGIGTKSDWDAAVQAIKEGGDGKAYVLTIAGNFEVDPSSSPTFGTVRNLTVTLQGSGTLTLNGNGSIFHLQGSSGAQRLNLHGNITLVGRKIDGNGAANNNVPVVYIGSNAALDMKNGTITGNRNTTNYSSGGVYVANNGDFAMSGNAVISGNSADRGGGVYVDTNGDFTMSGNAVISGNSASSSGGGVFVSGSEQYGGGRFTMSGGKISGNSAPSVSSGGGGVYVAGNGSFTMSGNAVISGNSAYRGGGVGLQASGSFTKSGNTIIYGDSDNIPYPNNGNATDNTATVVNCGNAVYVPGTGGGNPKRRENNAGTGVNLGYSYNAGTPITTGSWEFY